MPRLSVPLHRLSCVMSNPPDGALLVAKSLVCLAYKHRCEGLTYGGTGLTDPTLKVGIYANIDLTSSAPAALTSFADATWNADNKPDAVGTISTGGRDIYAILITKGGASVAHQTKKVGLICDSSMETEAIATSKVGELVEYAREVERALGCLSLEPTFVGTDNKANALIASGTGVPSRSRHCIRRYLAFLQRVKSQHLQIHHIPDENNPADFLTKWLGRKKLNLSIAYATNSVNVVL